MVQLTTSVVVAAILAGPALAAPMSHTSTHPRRQPPPPPRAQDPQRDRFPPGQGANVCSVPAPRVVTFEALEDLIAREPILKKVLGVAKKIGGTAVKVAGAALSAREFEELEELAARDPLVRNLVKKVATAAKRVGKNLNPMPPLGRDLEHVEDLEMRAIPRKGRGRSSSRTASSSTKPVGPSADIMAREPEDLEELAARDPLVRNLVKKVATAAKKVGKNLNPMPPLGRRELEDLEELAARDPLVRNLVKKVATAARKVGKNLNPMPPLGRDLENVEEIVAREYYDELD
ncbi:unnamed protein product [Cyclocybe aegerita]|uniref:Uncharacterized protein n=1 Tax=Cyclocybe aegerita TaxID=1973307 RepID=A0A8S0WBY0_CYCAE|nr:unnamed protein product [Cyclocybe aegerita]